MFPAAEILFDSRSHPVTLEALRDHLEKTLGGEYALTEWRGYAVVIPQLLVRGAHPWTIQIEADPEYVLDQIAELADEAVGVLSDEAIAKIRRCNATLVAMGASEQAPPPVIDGHVYVVAGTTLDPTDPEVRRTLLAAAALVDGLVFDLTEGEWIER